MEENPPLCSNISPSCRFCLGASDFPCAYFVRGGAAGGGGRVVQVRVRGGNRALERFCVEFCFVFFSCMLLNVLILDEASFGLAVLFVVNVRGQRWVQTAVQTIYARFVQDQHMPMTLVTGISLPFLLDESTLFLFFVSRTSCLLFLV